MTPEMIGLFEKLIALGTLVVLAYNAWLTSQVKKTLDPLPHAIDGAQDEMKAMREELGRLRGEKAGVAQEKADQALRDTVPALQPPSEATAPIPVVVLPNPEGLPIPVVNQDAPLLPDETRPKWGGTKPENEYKGR